MFRELRMNPHVNQAINARIRDPAVQHQYAEQLTQLSGRIFDAPDDFNQQAYALAADAGFVGALGLNNWSQDNVDTLQAFRQVFAAVDSSDEDRDDDSDSTPEFVDDGTDLEGDATDVEGDGIRGGNLANKISDVADTVGTAAGLAGLASGATGIGAVATPFLEGLSGVANATSFVSGLFGDGGSDDPHDKFMDATHVYCEQRGSGLFDQHLTVPEVMVAAQNLRENPSAARMYRQRLVTPGQAADSQFVSNLEYTALNQAKRPRRYTKVPRYRGTRHAKK
jgi:hypothetical protein